MCPSYVDTTYCMITCWSQKEPRASKNIQGAKGKIGEKRWPVEIMPDIIKKEKPVL